MKALYKLQLDLIKFPCITVNLDLFDTLISQISKLSGIIYNCYKYLKVAGKIKHFHGVC